MHLCVIINSIIIVIKISIVINSIIVILTIEIFIVFCALSLFL